MQHDSAMQVHPRTDAAYYSFLLRSLEAANSLGIDPAIAAAAKAFLCVSDPKALHLDDTRAGVMLKDLAGLVCPSTILDPLCVVLRNHSSLAFRLPSVISN